METSDGISDFPARSLARQLDFAAAVALTPTQFQSHSPLQPRIQSREQEGKSRPPSPPPQQQPPLEADGRLQSGRQTLPPQAPSRSPAPALARSKPQQPLAVTPAPPQSSKLRPQVPLMPRITHLAQKLPVSKYSVKKQDSPKSQLQLSVESKDGTPKKQKHCNCKNSRCLKLYCECFAAGTYCDGCNCLNCHNNADNEAARQEAVGAILERNPDAFRPKIAGSPHVSKVSQDDAQEVRIMGKHNKGCHCKKSGCLKKYCECFQANILCSDNCKCLDCKNFEESEERKALLHGHHNLTTYMQQAANAAISGAVGFSGYLSSLTPRKRKSEEVSYGVADKDLSIHRIPHHQQDACRQSNGVSSLLSIPVSCTTNEVVSANSKSTYRSPLADVIQPDDVKELCSLLVAVSTKVTEKLADKSKVDRERPKDQIAASISSSSSGWNDSDRIINSADQVCDNHICDNQAATDRGSDSGSDMASVQNERPLSPGTRALMCDEEHTVITEEDSTAMAGHYDTTKKSTEGHNFSKAYAEQERLVLSGFRNFLSQLVTYGSIKEKMSSTSAKSERGSNEPTKNSTIKAAAVLGKQREAHLNGAMRP